jgi:hypothetical protein
MHRAVWKRLLRLLKKKRKVAIGLRGNVIAPYDLPPARGARWTPLRKVDLIAAILGGVITLDEAKARYALTTEELSEWRRGLAAGGVKGLKVSGGRPSEKKARDERATG